MTFYERAFVTRTTLRFTYHIAHVSGLGPTEKHKMIPVTRIQKCTSPNTENDDENYKFVFRNTRQTSVVLK